MLTKDQITKAQIKNETKTFEVPEWDGDVNIAPLTGRQLDEYQSFVEDNEQPMQNIAWLLSRSLVDDDGVRVFTDNDLELITDCSLASLNRVGQYIAELNGMVVPDTEDPT